MARGIRVLALIVSVASIAAPEAPALMVGMVALPAEAADPPQVTVQDSQASIYTLEPADSCAQGDAVEEGCSQPDTQADPSIAVNPSNSLNAVSTFQEGRDAARGAATLGFATTFDGGGTWETGHLPGLTIAVGGHFKRSSKASVVFGPNDHVYATGVAFSFGNLVRTGVAFWRSTDGGRQWSQPILIAEDNLYLNDRDFQMDRSWVTVDLGSGPGHHPGRIYVAWRRISEVSPVFVAYSDDRGETWQTGPVGEGYPIYNVAVGLDPQPLVLPNGDLAVFLGDVTPLVPVHRSPAEVVSEIAAWQVQPPTIRWGMYVAKGAGSMTTGRPLVFTRETTVAIEDSRPVRQQRIVPRPAVGLDPGTGRIYFTWTDGRFRQDAGNDIVLAWSDDGGITWTYPVRVNRGPTNDSMNHWGPMLGVAPDGSVQIAYRTRREAEEIAEDGSTFSPIVDTYWLESRDGGTTFSTPLKVNAVNGDLGFAAVAADRALVTGTRTLETYLGDYFQLAIGGQYTYIARTEAVRTSDSEPAAYPPRFHHQRLWVAVVERAG